MASVTNSFSPSTVILSAKVNDNFQELSDAITPTFVSTIVGTLATGSSLTPQLIVPTGLVAIAVYLSVKTAPTGQSLIVDINLDGTSLWSVTPANRPTIAATGVFSSSASFDTTALSAESILTFDVDQVGSTIPGADLTIALKCEWA